jgi:two-component system, NarL family, nitrate/nitrite response regulator NarL
MKDTQARPTVPHRIRPPFHMLVVDDTACVLAGLCRLLETQPLIRVVGTAAQGNEALQMAEVLRPDVVLMDLNMPLVNGLQATAMLRHRLPDIRVIIMSVDDSPEAQASARAHGAHGFIWKPRMMSVLMTEIGRAFQLNPN